MDAASVKFYTIFCVRVLFSYICQHVVPGTDSLVKDEKGRALLIPDLDATFCADLPVDLEGCRHLGHFTMDSRHPLIEVVKSGREFFTAEYNL